MYEGAAMKDIILCLKAASEDQWEQIECAFDDGVGINFRYAHGWTYFHWTTNSQGNSTIQRELCDHCYQELAKNNYFNGQRRFINTRDFGSWHNYANSRSCASGVFYTHLGPRNTVVGFLGTSNLRQGGL